MTYSYEPFSERTGPFSSKESWKAIPSDNPEVYKFRHKSDHTRKLVLDLSEENTVKKDFNEPGWMIEASEKNGATSHYFTFYLDGEKDFQVLFASIDNGKRIVPVPLQDKKGYFYDELQVFLAEIFYYNKFPKGIYSNREDIKDFAEDRRIKIKYTEIDHEAVMALIN